MHKSGNKCSKWRLKRVQRSKVGVKLQQLCADRPLHLLIKPSNHALAYTQNQTFFVFIEERLHVYLERTSTFSPYGSRTPKHKLEML